MASNCHADLDLSVHARKESAIHIIDGEWVAFFGDQCVFLNKSRVYEISHGA